MFNIDKSHCYTTEQKLLWNIMELLQPKEAPLIITKEKEVEDTKDKNLCQHCGEVHANVGQRLACARKNKRKDVET